ncbi:MAG: DUF58 domain-containing protein [Desulfobacteraceae bacterium]|nr:DUF58 domain-containing protein [Desulfobacteraceae bacterium]
MNTGNNLVYIITSALLSYMLLSGIFGKRNLFNADAELLFPEEFFARTEALAEIRVRNRGKRMPLFLITVEASGGKCFFPFIGAGSSATGKIALTFERRGTAEISGLTVSSNYPFNFFERFRHIGKKARVIVYPKPLPCSLSALRDSGDKLRGEKDLNRPGYDSDILSIRDYVAGDHPRYINWKATAKTGKLKVKELSAIERTRVTIDFDGMEKGSLETVLSCTAYAVINYIRSRVPVGIKIQGETLEPDISASHKREILTRLALYGQS